MCACVHVERTREGGREGGGGGGGGGGFIQSTPKFECASPSAMPASVVDGDGEVPNKPTSY